jgi:hypothetical protein
VTSGRTGRLHRAATTRAAPPTLSRPAGARRFGQNDGADRPSPQARLVTIVMSLIRPRRRVRMSITRRVIETMGRRQDPSRGGQRPDLAPPIRKLRTIRSPD